MGSFNQLRQVEVGLGAAGAPGGIAVAGSVEVDQSGYRSPVVAEAGDLQDSTLGSGGVDAKDTPMAEKYYDID